MTDVPPTDPVALLVPVSAGELLDKITILEIKSERISDVSKVENVCRELAALCEARDRAIPSSVEVAAVSADLKQVNEKLWDVEDAIRLCEGWQDFGPRFIELARSVYRLNDQRAALKRHLNDLLGSALKEEKSYTSAD
jgi:hypothetical protein